MENKYIVNSRKSSFQCHSENLIKIKFSLGKLVSFFVSYLTYRKKQQNVQKLWVYCLNSYIIYLYIVYVYIKFVIATAVAAAAPVNELLIAQVSSLKTIWYFFVGCGCCCCAKLEFLALQFVHSLSLASLF